MVSRINLDFLKLYWALPRSVQDRAWTAYRQWAANPAHPGLAFKQVHPTIPLWSARIDGDYRAVGLVTTAPDGVRTIQWFFVGTHAAYDRLLRLSGPAARGQSAKAAPARRLRRAATRTGSS